MKLNWKENDLTGRMEANFSAKLISVSESTFKNVNETEYRIAGIELENGNQVQGLMYEKNFEHGVEIGNSYSCRAIYDKENPENLLITISHLPSAKRASLEDFGLTIEDVQPADDFAKVNKKVKEEVE
jgi:hypothetical protein